MKRIRRNKQRADRVIQFCECLTVPSGIGAGNRVRLRRFQKSFFRDIYEPMDKDGLRIVSDAVWSMGRKNSKTTSIAFLVLCHLVGPEAVENGEIYSAANDRKQAAIIYKVIKQIIEADPVLDAKQGGLLTCIDSKSRIVCLSNGSFYESLSRESGTKHGLNPTVVIYDELAQARDRDLYDTLNTAFGAREESLFVVISTQSKDPNHILSELIDAGLSSNNPEVVCHLHACPDWVLEKQFCKKCKIHFERKFTTCPECGNEKLEASYFDERLWKQANPALGDFKPMKKIRKIAKQAKETPSFLPSFLNLELNLRVDLQPSIVSVQDWRACHDPQTALIDGEEIYLGLDLSAKIDLTSLGAVSAKDDDRIASWSWKPADTLATHEKRDRFAYYKMVKEGYLLTTPGRVVEYEDVAKKIVELSERYVIKGIAFDRWHIDDLLKALGKQGIDAFADKDGKHDKFARGLRFVPWGQGYRDMGPAVAAFVEAVQRRSLKHDGNPLLTWTMSNTKGVPDASGWMKPDKEKARYRIDPAVALIMALGLKARDMVEEKRLNEFIMNPIKAA